MKKLSIILMIMLVFGLTSDESQAFDDLGIEINGFVSQGYLKSGEYNYLVNKSEDGSFEYNEMGINFSKQLNDKLRIGLQFFARDVGDAANNKITVDWAYADYHFKDWLGLRVGKIKLPLGLYNEIRDIDMLRTCIVLPQGIYNDLLRDNLIAASGAAIYGNKDLDALGNISYQFVTGALPSDFDGGTGKYFENTLSGTGIRFNGNYDPKTTYAGSLWWETPLESLKVGFSYFDTSAVSPVTIGGVISTTLEADHKSQIFSLEYTRDGLLVSVEYMERENDAVVMGNESSSTLESYYILASYVVNDWFTVGGYYSETYPDKDDKDGLNQVVDHMAWEKDIALTLRFDMNENWVLKVEGHSIDGSANVMVVDNQDNLFSDSNHYYGAAKITVSF